MSDDGNEGVAGAANIVNHVMIPWYMGGPWLPTFEGKQGEKVIEWRTKIEMFLRAQGLPAEQKVDFILSALGGEAKREILLVSPDERDTDKKILDFLSSLYGGSQALATLRAQFYECRQGAEEGMGTFILRFRELYHKWQVRDPPSQGTEDELLRTQFIRGLQENPVKQELKRLLRRTPEMTFPAICIEAKALEREQTNDGTETWACRTYNPGPPQTRPSALPTQAPAPLQSSSSTLETRSSIPSAAPDTQAMWASLRAELQRDLKDQMSALGRSLAEEMRTQIANLSLGPTNLPLQTRDRPTGPTSQQRPRRQPPVTPRDQFQWDPQGRPICLDCGQAGHTRRFCPRRRTGPSDF